jgi:radical SAM superfamily enzyme YgiQ (UPF0313 family)
MKKVKKRSSKARKTGEKKKKTALLVDPGTKISTFPPIGILHVASAIRDKYVVKIKDYSGKDLDERKIAQEIREINPFIVGLSVLTGPNIPRALLISKVAKKLNIPVIWGGPHPTILPKQTLENKYVDAVCIGEGEYTILDLLDYYRGKKKLKNVRGAGIKEKGKTWILPYQKKFVNFEEMPMPAWDLLEDIDRYFPEKKHNVLPLSTTRGCAFKCGFCHNSNKNVKCYLGSYRIAPPRRAIEELRFIKKLTKKHIDILDVGEDLHLVSESYAKEFCKEIANSGIRNLKWYTSMRYSVLNPEIVRMIAAHNCKRILLGVESGSKRIQDMNGKIVDFQHAKKMSSLLRKRVYLLLMLIFLDILQKQLKN